MSIIVKNGEGQSILLVQKPTAAVSIKGLVGGAADAHYTHIQSTPEAIWEVTHNLNKKPTVTVVDSADTMVMGEVEYINNNSVRLTFAGAFSGKAYFN